MSQVIAVDWSGRATGASESIWLAVVRDGDLVELENGFERGEAIGRIVELAARDRETVVGIDFAFSFPEWYCVDEGWSSGFHVWTAMAARSDRILGACEPPFWGRAGTVAQSIGPAHRRTDLDVGGNAKSVFQIGGAGGVGTGSVRGMPFLAFLSRAGFAIWPFHAPRMPMVVEIYPRRFVPDGVVKSRHLSRRAHLERHHGNVDDGLRERAAGSEDAFDATVSALAMAAHFSEFLELPRFAPGSPELIEGAIWAPRPSGVAAAGLSDAPPS
jgi:hypothetical protein